jgi:hypothetical protein
MGRAAKLASYLIPGLVAVITFVVFSPALRNGFVNWDDFETIVENQNFRGFTWSHLRWMFTTFHLGHYQPLSWLTFSLDYRLWGMDAFGYHLTNILLHSANAVLFYFVTLRLLAIAAPISSAVVLMLAAGFSALLFAIHPLRVESVAWATERRDVLSAFFLLLTVLSYLKAVDLANNTSGRRWIAVSAVLYVLSLLAKASGITLPLVLLVLDVYPLRRLGGGAGRWFGVDARRVWLEKLPFFIAAAAAGAVALTAQQKAGALVTTETHDLAGRVAQGLYGVTFYIVKTLEPTDLAPLYEIPPELHLFHWRVIFAAVVFLLISLGFFLARHRWPAALTGWVAYLLLLAGPGCRPSRPTTGGGSLQLSVVHGLGGAFGNRAVPPLAAVDWSAWPGRRRSFHSDSPVCAFRLKYLDLETDRNLARFGNTLESRACRESFEHGSLSCGQVHGPAGRFG